MKIILRNVSCIFSTLSRNVFQTMFQTQEIYETPTLFNVPDDYWTQEMCERATERSLYALKEVPDQYKAKEMCEK